MPTKSKHPIHAGLFSCELADKCLYIIDDMEQQLELLQDAITKMQHVLYREAREHIDWRVAGGDAGGGADADS